MRAFVGLLATLLTLSACSDGEDTEIGSTLNDKVAVDIADVPAEVMQVVKSARADLNFEKAERVVRNGAVYFDIEGEDADGNEVELDLIKAEDGSWRVVEIQRDISWGITPEPVRAALRDFDDTIVPARIIESDQGGGVIIYEFFTQSSDGEEKYEVKFANGAADYLTEEWIH